ncbi:MAG: HIT family protein [Acholeplasmatales bacterium]|jgi:histidine triad (HIT) family protein|nr:HIT family protein [Acholeplasmatales bacterium]
MCIFCKIVNGEIPSKKVYEDDKVLAILDLSQAEKGHTLVIPKAHFDTMLDADSQTVSHAFEVASKLANKIKTNLNADGINILNNSYEAAGQTVMHMHIHIIPRYKNDDLKIEFTDHSSLYNLDDVLAEINK